MRIDPQADRAMVEASSRRTPRGPWMHLLAALLGLAGGKAELVRHSEHAWSSVTFSGTRHTVLLAFTGAEGVAAGETFIDALPDHEFTIPRQLVADAAVVSVEHLLLPEPRLSVEVELLLLDDA
ncbi:MAG TPA: hypothetical protein VHG29_10545 [Novosphingobium sp.]|nr:hypothetical protein [Novosphingobium sp.]